MRFAPGPGNNNEWLEEDSPNPVAFRDVSLPQPVARLELTHVAVLPKDLGISFNEA